MFTGGPIAITMPGMVAIGLVLAVWTAVAAYALLRSRRQESVAGADRNALARYNQIMEDAPALPLLVRGDDRIEAPERLARWFGFAEMPNRLSGLVGDDRGLDEEQLAALRAHIAATRTSAKPFASLLHARRGRGALRAEGHLAAPGVARGAVVVWIFDASDTAAEIDRLAEEGENARADFSALVGLIEAAPVPMWFRSDDASLRLVNTAYVNAVGAANAEQVVAQNIELVEPVEGLTAPEVAMQARDSERPITRNVMVTIDGTRRAFQVSDLPVGRDGVAGYAIDVEEAQQLGREYRAFRAAQRTLLDQLSSGVAQFDANRNLIFVNQPMQRLFRLPDGIGRAATPVSRVLDIMRDAGRLPEVRDFPAWRRQVEEWFIASGPQDEEWVLADGTHLRIVAQPMPDGGLMMIVEDRTEQLKLASARDTLLRTRTATLDSLFEGLVVIAPDGRLQQWNRRFAEEWSLKERFLGKHPHIDELLEQVKPQLAHGKDAARIGLVIEAATLRREQTRGNISLADGRTLALIGVPLPDGNGMLTSLDITDSQKAEAALMERNAALVEADAVKTRFLANMSYEFRTPLTSITGFAEMLREGVAGELSETGKDYVGAILSSTERLSDQIESVLELTQSEAGLLPMADEQVELMPLVTNLVQDRAARIEAGGLTLNLRGDRSSGEVKGDSRRLSRAIGNVIDNAIAASGRGGRIDIDLRRRRGEVQIVVVHRVPEVESDAEAARQHATLGLPLARELIEAHRGRLDYAQVGADSVVATIALP